jgi:sirohydrochlorin ferrochelatase
LKILLSHGSPNDVHRHAVEALAERVSGLLEEPVNAAFLGDDLPEGAKILPLFLLHGRHLTTDVPKMLEATKSRLVAGPAAYPAEMAQMAFELASTQRKKQRAVMFALYRLGAADALMAELYERSKKFSLPAITALHGQCDVASVLDLWKAEEIREVLIQPVLLFPGHSVDALDDIAGKSGLEYSIGPALSEHPDFTDWLAGKFREAA